MFHLTPDQPRTDVDEAHLLGLMAEQSLLFHLLAVVCYCSIKVH